MRSSKSRSRSKQNRNRSVGNIINRVFDSSGPEGKVRGTPQQIIDKYNQLARDAQLSNDRVAAENFQQHSEHYTRMLAEAMREMESQRPQQENYNGNGQNGGNGQHRGEHQGRGDGQGRNDGQGRGDGQNRADGQGRNEGQNRSEGRNDQQPRFEERAEREEPRTQRAPEPEPVTDSTAFAVDAPAEEGDSGLVETPESAPKPKSTRSRRPRNPAPQSSPAETTE